MAVGDAALPALLRARGLSVEAGGTPLLSGVDLEVARGECLGIVGETGCGKSVTCRAMTGSLARRGARPHGELTFDGIDLVGLSEKGWRALRGRRIALVPQSSQTSLDPVMRIGAQLRETVRAVGEEGEDVSARVAELLEQVEMPRPAEALRKYPHELSGGMRQRTMIALAMAGRPELLLADEPTTALDVTVQRSILHLLQTLCAERGMTLVLITHDLAVVEQMSDRIAVMYAGMTVEHGPAQALLSAPRHPYTRALLAARPGLDGGARLSGIPGAPPSVGEWPRGCRFAARCPHRREACEAAPVALAPIAPGHEVACIRAEELHHG